MQCSECGVAEGDLPGWAHVETVEDGRWRVHYVRCRTYVLDRTLEVSVRCSIDFRDEAGRALFTWRVLDVATGIDVTGGCRDLWMAIDEAMMPIHERGRWDPLESTTQRLASNLNRQRRKAA